MNSVLKTIRDHQSFLISTHVSPDPDAICSELAMAEYLRQQKKKFWIINEEPLPARYKIFSGSNQIQSLAQFKAQPIDVAIVLDCGDLERIGKVQSLLSTSTKIVNIDHHITNQEYGQINLVRPEASSTAELLYDLLKKGKCQFNDQLARNLYAGIMTDTGSFRYENTTSKTHEIAAALMKFDIGAAKLYQQIYEIIPLKDLQSFTKVINGFEAMYQDQLIVVTLTKKAISVFSEDFDLRDMIFRLLRSIHGAKVFVILTEVDRKTTRLNFRSSGIVNVAQIAKNFKGGGHKNASGGICQQGLSDAKNTVVQYIRKFL